MSFPVAVQLYSVRKEAKEDFRGTLQKIKDMGYDGVEFAGLHGVAPEDVKQMCEEIGLVPISAHVPYIDMLANPKKILGDYAAIGCKYIAVPYLTPEYRPGTEEFPNVIKNVSMLGTVAKNLGMKLLYHNHDFEFVKIDGEYALDVLYAEVNPDRLATEIDVCWVNVAGVDPSAYIKKYAGRSPIVHLKDFYGEKSDDMYELIGIESKAPVRPSAFEFRPLGKGLQDIPAVLEAAKLAGTKWVVVEQDNPSMGLTPMESIKASIDYLKEINK